MGEPDPRRVMLGSGSPTSLIVMVMMVKMMMMVMMMGEPDTLMSHVGVGFPRLLDSDGDDANYEDAGGTRPPHESCWRRVPPPPLQENLLFLL